MKKKERWDGKNIFHQQNNCSFISLLGRRSREHGSHGDRDSAKPTSSSSNGNKAAESSHSASKAHKSSSRNGISRHDGDCSGKDKSRPNGRMQDDHSVDMFDDRSKHHRRDRYSRDHSPSDRRHRNDLPSSSRGDDRRSLVTKSSHSSGQDKVDQRTHHSPTSSKWSQSQTKKRRWNRSDEKVCWMFLK